MTIKTTLIGLAALALAGSVVGSTSSAYGYGSADQPQAQVEISGNCDNPDFPFCRDVVGTGGVWAWAELDNVASTTPGWNQMDSTIAFCQHVQGSAPPHTSGGGGGPDPIGVWQEFSSLQAAQQAIGGIGEPLLTLGGGNPYTGAVYVLDFFPGTGPDDFVPIVPVTQGHYSAQPVPGVNLQVQVAP